MYPVDVMFVCQICRQVFEKIDNFFVHKQEKHFDEFQHVKCIAFEERIVAPVSHDNDYESISSASCHSINADDDEIEEVCVDTTFKANNLGEELSVLQQDTGLSAFHPQYENQNLSQIQPRKQLILVESSDVFNHNHNHNAQQLLRQAVNETITAENMRPGLRSGTLDSVELDLEDAPTSDEVTILSPSNDELTQKQNRFDLLLQKIGKESLRQSSNLENIQSSVQSNPHKNDGSDSLYQSPLQSSDDNHDGTEFEVTASSPKNMCKTLLVMDQSCNPAEETEFDSDWRTFSEQDEIQNQNETLNHSLLPDQLPTSHKVNFKKLLEKKIHIGKFTPNFRDSLTLKDWILEQRSISRKTKTTNVILLDPDPVTKNLGPITPNNPISCILCRESFKCDWQVKNHVKFCWLYNKQRHCFCKVCNLSFLNPNLYQHHYLSKHNSDSRLMSMPTSTLTKSQDSNTSYMNTVEDPPEVVTLE